MAVPRVKADAVVEEVNTAVKEIMKRYGLTITGVRATLGKDLSIRISCVDAGVTPEPMFVSEEALERGAAQVGQIAYFFDRNVGEEGGEWVPARILDSRVKKYLIEFIDDPSLGKFTAPFGGFSLQDPGTPITNPYLEGTQYHREFIAFHNRAYRCKPHLESSALAYVDLMYLNNNYSEKEVIERFKELGIMTSSGAWSKTHKHYSVIMKYITDKYI